MNLATGDMTKVVLREVTERARGRCECRGPCGRHRGRCGETDGQGSLLAGGAGPLAPVLRGVRSPSIIKARNVVMVCALCRETYRPGPKPEEGA